MRLAPVAAAAALLLVPAAASASCRSKIGAGAHVVERTKNAVVYRRHDDPKINNTFYGCELRTGKLRRVNRFQEQRVGDFKLAGRYLGYTLWVEEGASSDVLQNLHVLDLRTGKERLVHGAVEPPTPSKGDQFEGIASYVLKPNASVAWIAEFRPDPNDVATSFQVNRIETSRDDAFTTLDSGDGIARRSMALSDDGKHVYWRHGKAARTARLR
ncbi:MAG: hypothetical protein ACJ760_14630 [Thermoleophilaceae bacterium]